ncbi:MAG: hypothetical protein ACQES5_10000 [Thermodesulfobacteriota bacterium]
MQYKLGCPRCGAPIGLDESEHIIDCPYCRVRHIITSPGHLTCLIPPRHENRPEKTIYVPYWHFRGLTFAMTGPEIRHRILDISYLAARIKGIPYSLGLRTQTQSLHFAGPNSNSLYIKPAIKKNSLVRKIGSRLLGLGPSQAEPPLQSHIGDLVMLVHSPVFALKDKIYDGLTGNMLKEVSPYSILKQSAPEPDTKPSFQPAICPHCGWDLCGDNSSLIQFCDNCRRMWTSIQGKLHNIDYAFAGEKDARLTWLPFWEIEVKNSMLGLNSRDDLVRLANLPRVTDAKADSKPLTFLIPAFKLNPALFLRLSRQSTVFGFASKKPRDFNPSDTFPCTLPVSEAYEAIIPVIYDLAQDKKDIRSRLSRSKFLLRRCRALFLPFMEQGSELIQPDMNVAVPASALRFGQKL